MKVLLFTSWKYSGLVLTLNFRLSRSTKTRAHTHTHTQSFSCMWQQREITKPKQGMSLSHVKQIRHWQPVKQISHWQPWTRWEQLPPQSPLLFLQPRPQRGARTAASAPRRRRKHWGRLCPCLEGPLWGSRVPFLLVYHWLNWVHMGDAENVL